MLKNKTKNNPRKYVNVEAFHLSSAVEDVALCGIFVFLINFHIRERSKQPGGGGWP